MQYTIKEMPQELRPREELKCRGAKALSNAQLLAIVLRNGLRGENVCRLAENILSKVGGIEKLAAMTLREICALKIPGVGEVKATEIVAALELGGRAAKRSRSADSIQLNEPGKVYELMLREFPERELQEKFWLIPVDVHNRTLSPPICIASGAHDQCPLAPADVIRKAIQCGAHGFFVAHNHPSGDPTPSYADVDFTKRLKEAAELMGLEFFDHLVLGKPTARNSDGYISLRAEGKI